MPIVFIFFGFRFLFFSNDHEPIHIHVVKGSGPIVESAKFNVLPEITLVENDGLKHSELKMAEAVIEDNKDIIIERWNEFFKNR